MNTCTTCNWWIRSEKKSEAPHWGICNMEENPNSTAGTSDGVGPGGQLHTQALHGCVDWMKIQPKGPQYGTPGGPCDGCWGTGNEHQVDGKYGLQVASDDPCESCKGTGITPLDPNDTNLIGKWVLMIEDGIFYASATIFDHDDEGLEEAFVYQKKRPKGTILFWTQQMADHYGPEYW